MIISEADYNKQIIMKYLLSRVALISAAILVGQVFAQDKMFIGDIDGPDARLAHNMLKKLANSDKDVTFIDTSDLLKAGQ